MRSKDETDPNREEDLRRTVIRSVNHAAAVHALVLCSAERTASWLGSIAGSPMDLLSALRFQTVGHDPVSGDALNVIETINQTFNILVSLRGSNVSLKCARKHYDFWHPGTDRVIQDPVLFLSEIA